ncbi:MAG: hypothetical protein NEHIOOID_00908 [Holosporales bacterium]
MAIPQVNYFYIRLFFSHSSSFCLRFFNLFMRLRFLHPHSQLMLRKHLTKC